jgi:hypothetical protein
MHCHRNADFDASKRLATEFLFDQPYYRFSFALGFTQ